MLQELRKHHLLGSSSVRVCQECATGDSEAMGNTLEVDEVNRVSSERTEVILHVLAPPEGFCLGAVGILRLSFGAACRASL